MGMTPDDLIDDLSPIVAGLDLTLHDVEFAKGLLRVTVRGPKGVTLEQLAEANRAISAHLDENDPFDGRYTLEVSSPGVERKLRRPNHFAAAIGENVAIRTLADVATVPGRRLEGELLEATGDGIVVNGPDGAAIPLHYDQIERARTVYQWAPLGKPSPSRGGSPKRSRARQTTSAEKVMMP